MKVFSGKHPRELFERVRAGVVSDAVVKWTSQAYIRVSIPDGDSYEAHMIRRNNSLTVEIPYSFVLSESAKSGKLVVE